MNIPAIRRGLSWAALLVALCVGVPASADDEYQKIIWVRVGDEAPAIQLKDDQGATWRLSDHVGKKNIVVYFYLGDFMPACTKQAVAYRDALRRIQAYGAEVVGISGDSVATHAKFKQESKLTFRLLADVDGEVTKAYGVSVSGPSATKVKDARGNVTRYERNITASRWTWVIGKDGRIIYKAMNVNPAEDTKQLLAFLAKQAAEK
jgi:peroxiredoxin Q/BCP